MFYRANPPTLYLQSSTHVNKESVCRILYLLFPMKRFDCMHQFCTHQKLVWSSVMRYLMVLQSFYSIFIVFYYISYFSNWLLYVDWAAALVSMHVSLRFPIFNAIFPDFPSWASNLMLFEIFLSIWQCQFYLSMQKFAVQFYLCNLGCVIFGVQYWVCNVWCLILGV